MLRKTIVLTCWLYFGLTNAQQKSDTQLAEEFDKVLSKQFAANNAGATVLVAHKGRVIYSKAFGMANLELETSMQTDNVFRIGSITKQFTAVAILQLIEQGKLGLQDEITKFIPDYPTQGNRITLEHLLTHTSGIQNYTSIKNNQQREGLDFTTTEMIDYFKGQPMKFASGTNWSYSNSNYFLLGYIIEKISGKTYGEYVDEHFFKPLGMKNSFYAADTKIIKKRAGGYSKNNEAFENAKPLSITQPYAAGAVQSTVADLFKWHQAVHSYKLVKKEILDKAFKPFKLTDGRETAYGYGWRIGNVYENPSLWHGGLINGFMAMETYLPKQDVFVAVFSNCDCYSLDVITSRLAALTSGEPYEYKEISTDNLMLEDYVGVYENQKGLQQIITKSDKGINIQTGHAPMSKLKAYAKDSFYTDNIHGFTFSRNKKGQVANLTTRNLNGNETWNKTTKPLPDENGMKVDRKILETYAGEYQLSPEFIFKIILQNEQLFLHAPEQDKVEMYAESNTKFFLKVNDAQFEFIKDESGRITDVVMSQGGRQAKSKKVK